MDDQGYLCRRCGQLHEGLPFSYGAEAPEYWHDELVGDEHSVLEDEICIVQAQHYFVRARLVIPVLDAEEDFVWGVWVSLSKDNFARVLDLWTTEGREREPAYFGWLSTQLSVYPTATLSLKTEVHSGPVGERPHVVLEPTGHPLALEQRNGITTERVREIADTLLHP